MNRCLSVWVVLLLFSSSSCKNKVKDGNAAGTFFPVLSYLQSQVRQVDTALFSITKITRTANRTDTAYIPREAFRAAAHDFLALPDIAAAPQQYTETKLYDGDLKKVVLSYAPTDKTTATEIVRQDVLIEPGSDGADAVQTIYTETAVRAGDSLVQKRLTWNVARSFQVIKIVTKKNAPETVETTDVIWGAPL